MLNEIALQKNLRDVVAEYDQKLAAIPGAISAFTKAGDDVKAAVTIAGVWGDVRIETGSIYDRQSQESLLKSAWKHVYDGLNIDCINSAKDKRLWQHVWTAPWMQELRREF
jgi:hypothetical protein